MTDHCLKELTSIIKLDNLISFKAFFSTYLLYLQWNLTTTPKTWAGLVVKVQFKCEETTGFNIYNVAETEHCVVIKYTGVFKGKPPNKIVK